MNKKILAMSVMAVFLTTASGCTTEIKVLKDAKKDVHGIGKHIKNAIAVAKGLNSLATQLPPIPVNYNWSYDQSWTEAQSKWFWHVPQGTYQIPYSWFVSLEKPIGAKFNVKGNKDYTSMDLVRAMADDPKLEDMEQYLSPEVLKEEEADAAAVDHSTATIKDKSHLFIDDNYLAGFGVIPVPQTQEYASKNNPDLLPLGLTRNDKFVNPHQKNAKTQTVMGFGCALCHTSRIDYKGKAMLIDGAPSQANLTLLVEKLAVSLGETFIIPTRFNRFAKRVYGHKPSKAEKKKLKAEITAYAIATARQYKTPEGSTDSGYGRLDALTAIGNIVFGAADLNAPENARASNAPVSYPMIWTVPWFQWAEYPGVVEQPMVRNVGEALGVFAPVNLTSSDPADVFKSTVMVDNLYRIETLLMEGSVPKNIAIPPADPYTYINKHKSLPGLSSPKWPEKMLGKIDHAKANKGAKLYAQLCQGCHLPPLSSPELYKRDAHNNLNLKYWTAKNRWGKQYLNVVNVGVEEIGTDNTEMMNFYERTAVTGNLTVQGTPLESASAATKDGVKKLGTLLSAADGLKVVTAAVANKWYAENGIVKDPAHITPKEQATVDMLNGYRENVVNMAPATYRARPLDGIWATPTYLHNGSVANLYQLLSPVSERATQFVTGKKEFDPVNVGYETCFDQACIKKLKSKGYSVFSVNDDEGNPITGNSNAGHEFTGDGKTNTGDGVIGRALSSEERWDLVEYLKTL